MTQQNDGHGQDSNTMQTAAQEAGRTRGLARWYWGTAGLLIVVALGMSTFAGRQVTQGGPQGQEQAESAGGWTDAAMRKAEQAAMEVVNKIDPELEAAFAPVYAGIPRYLDFHYSLKGEWLELSASVLNQMESELERDLFDGLDDKIERISQELQIDFHQRWRASIEASLAESPAATGPFAELARLSIEDARDRIEKTAVMVGVGTAALVVVPRIVAKKLGTRIAGKVAIKTGARMATVASGAGAGGILCSWAGPVAAACAVGGGVISWVTVDLAMIKLDEHVNRDEFQQELRDLVSEQKAAIRTDLHNLVTERLLGSAQATRKETVMTISLAELPDYTRRVACEAVEEIMPHYGPMVDTLRGRSPATVNTVIDLLEQHEDDRLLAPWVDRVRDSIRGEDLSIKLDDHVKMRVEVPQDLQNSYEMRADLMIGNTEIATRWIAPDLDGNFVFRIPVVEENGLALAGSQRFYVNLYQDRGLGRRNRHFSGGTSFLPHTILPEGPGLAVTGEIAVTTHAAGEIGSGPRVLVEIPVMGAPLEEVPPPEFCTI